MKGGASFLRYFRSPHPGHKRQEPLEQLQTADVLAEDRETLTI